MSSTLQPIDKYINLLDWGLAGLLHVLDRDRVKMLARSGEGDDLSEKDVDRAVHVKQPVFGIKVPDEQFVNGIVERSADGCLLKPMSN